MIRFRTKYWFGLCGANSFMALFGALVGSKMVVIALSIAVGSWYYAEYLLKQDQENKNG